MKQLYKLIENLDQKTKSEFLLNHGLIGFFDHNSIEYKKQYLKNSLLLQEINSFFSSNSKIKDDIVLLKGPALLLLNVYESLGERNISDIDLLTDNMEQVKNYLLTMGYKVILENKWKENAYKINLTKTISQVEIVVELHAKIFRKLENSQLQYSNFGDVRVLNHESMLLHLMGHLVQQHTFLKLDWLNDIFLYLMKYQNQIDYKKLKEMAIKHKLVNSYRLTALALKIVFDVDLFKEERYSYLEKKLITKKFLMFPDQNKRRYFLVKHITRNSIFDSLIYDLDWIMASGWRKNG